jgi:hypothetical protein
MARPLHQILQKQVISPLLRLPQKYLRAVQLKPDILTNIVVELHSLFSGAGFMPAGADTANARHRFLPFEKGSAARPLSPIDRSSRLN